MNESLSYYCRYNHWANFKLANFFSNKPEKQLSQTIENSFPSIRKTLLHMFSAERSWLARMEQEKAKNHEVMDDEASTQELLFDLVSTSQQFLDFVKQKDEKFMNHPISYTTWDGTQWTMTPKIMIRHCMNHSTYHRGQLITLARQLEMKEGIPSTDLLYFHREECE